MNLKNFPALQRFFCKFLRIEADTEIVLDQGQTLIGRCNFQIRTERKAVGRKVLDMKISGAGVILQRDKRIFRKFFQRADVRSQFFVFRTGDQNFPERTREIFWNCFWTERGVVTTAKSTSPLSREAIACGVEWLEILSLTCG